MRTSSFLPSSSYNACDCHRSVAETCLVGGGGGGTCVSACLFVETFFLVRLRLSARLLLFRNVKHFNYEQHIPLLYFFNSLIDISIRFSIFSTRNARSCTMRIKASFSSMLLFSSVTTAGGGGGAGGLRGGDTTFLHGLIITRTSVGIRVCVTPICDSSCSAFE